MKIYEIHFGDYSVTESGSLLKNSNTMLYENLKDAISDFKYWANELKTDKSYCTDFLIKNTLQLLQVDSGEVSVLKECQF